jgi:Mrp family chromosome partitioning ATPase
MEEAIQTVDVPGLYVLPSGPLLEDPSLILGNKLLRPVMESLRDRYSWIIVDTASGLAYTDAIITSTVLDGVVMVTAAGVISRGSEDRLLGDFDTVGTVILGAVVNKVLPQNADTLYHYEHYRRTMASEQSDSPDEPRADTPLDDPAEC